MYLLHGLCRGISERLSKLWRRFCVQTRPPKRRVDQISSLPSLQCETIQSQTTRRISCQVQRHPTSRPLIFSLKTTSIMEKEEILDIGLSLNNENVTHLIKWWESKRLSYNLILIVVEIMVLVANWRGTLNMGIPLAIFYCILYNSVANAFYTIGWGIELWIKYYFPSFNLGKNTRLFLLIAGIFLSILVTYSWITVEISYSMGLNQKWE